MTYHNWGFSRLGSDTGANVCFDLLGVRSRLATVSYAVSMNTTSTDVAVPIAVVPDGFAGTQTYILRGVLFTNASATLATSPTVSLWTGAGGTGSQLINAQSLSTLTAANLFVDGSLTATATSTLLNATTLFIRTGAANPTAATVDVYFYVEVPL